MKIGIIGCGVIGQELIKTVDNLDGMDLVGIFDLDKERAGERFLELDELVDSSDLVIEAASPDAVPEVLGKAIDKGKDVMIMSVGGLLKDPADINVYLPSGAICGLDGVKSASVGKIESVTLTTTKPPKGLEGAPYIVENNVDLNVSEKTVIFEGSAADAVKGFPKNINVSAVLSTAGIGPERTKVKIVVDPAADKNMHEIEVIGEFGRLTTKTENVPSPQNPKTSYLAVLSAVATLKQISSNIRIG